MNSYYQKRQRESGWQSKVVFWCIIGIIILLIMAAITQGADLRAELPVIRKAAERNGIRAGTPDWYLLLSIRMAENGTKYQFGVVNNMIAYNLDKQAAWCAASIMKHHTRYGSPKVDKGYIESLAARYCPVGASNDPVGLNRNWIKNVMYWYEKLQKGN